MQHGGKLLRVMHVHDFYPAYLEDFYSRNPDLVMKSSWKQTQALLKDAFSAIHLFSMYLPKNRYKAEFAVPHALPLQYIWARERQQVFPEENWELEMLRRRIEHFKPDVLYFADPVRYNREFLSSLSHKPKLVMGWKAADVPWNLDLSGYDVILSGLPKMLKFAEHQGAKKGILFKPGMPQWLADEVADVPKTVDVCFVGSISPSQHAKRQEMLDSLAKSAASGSFSLALYLNCDPEFISPAMRPYIRKPVFGLDMQKALAGARIVIDSCGEIGVISPNGKRIIDLAESDTINMRLFEATASGSLLLTENRHGVEKFFTPGKEIDLWSDYSSLQSKISYWLAHDVEREKVARAGKLRCLQEHGMAQAAQSFADIIEREIKNK